MMWWFFPPTKQFDNTKAPQMDSVVQLSSPLLSRLAVQDSKYFFLGYLLSSLNYISTMGSAGSTAKKAIKELIEYSNLRGGGSWSASAWKMEKIGTSILIEGSRFSSLNPSLSLESDPISKQEEYEKSYAVSTGDIYPDRAVEENNYEST